MIPSPTLTGLSFAFDMSYRKFEQAATPQSQTDRTASAPVYRKLPLPTRLPRMLGPLGQALALRTSDSPDLPESTRLATLLHYGAGILRLEPLSLYKEHRGFPSARSLFPTQTWLAIPGGGDWPRGVYRYEPAGHWLEQVGSDLVWDDLEAALGAETPSYDTVPLFLFSDARRLTDKYGDFAYNLCCLETGHTIGTLQAVAAALGYYATVRYLFADGQLRQATGDRLNPCLLQAVLLLRRGEPHAVKDDLPVSSAVPFEFPSIPEAPRIAEVERASAIRALPCLSLQAMPPAGAGECDGMTMDLAEALEQRNSGWGAGLGATAEPLSRTVLQSALRLAPVTYGCDLPLQDFMGLFVAVNNVDGVDPGVYRYHPERDVLEPVRTGWVGGALQEMYTYGADHGNLGSFPCVIFITADYPSLMRNWGARGYRMVNMHGGLVAQRITLAWTAAGMSVRPIRAFREARADALLGLSAGSQSAIYALVVGRSRHTTIQFHLSL